MHPDIELDAWISRINALPYFARRIAIATRLTPPFTRFMYKYRAVDAKSEQSINQLREILIESKLWLSAPLDFNDPFDTSARIVAEGKMKSVRTRMERIGKSQGLRRKERKAYAKAIEKIPRSQLERDLSATYEKSLEMVGVHCFAGDPRSILMWSHYANNHKGVCIQFERAKDFPLLCRALSVDYSDNYPTVNWVRGFGPSLSKVLLKKSLCWAYEAEERLIKPDKARQYLQFNPAAISAVIYGCRVSADVRQIVEEILNERKRLHPPLRVYAAAKHRSRYRLQLARVAS